MTPKLYRLQQVDSQIMLTNRKIAALDAGDSLKAVLDAALAQENELSAKLKALTAEVHDIELQDKATDDKIKGFETKLYSGKVASPKELQALELDIQSLKKYRGTLDDRVIGLWDEIEALKVEFEAASRAREAAEVEYAAHMEQYLSEKSKLEAQLAEATAKREEMAAEIDAPSLAKYDAVRKKCGGLAVILVEDNTCKACNTAVTAFIMTKIKNDPVFVACESCGRLLHWIGG